MATPAQRVKQDLESYCANLRRTTNEYDPGLQQATEYFLQCLEQSNSAPAQLVMLGAQLCDLTDDAVVLVAARAVQMTHVATHMNTQTAQAKAAAGIGMHAAHILLANMNAPQDLKIKMLSITNRALMLHNQAQAYQDQSKAADAYATELVLNPLHVGMVLADADCAATDAITPFALALGRYAHMGQANDLQRVATEQRQLAQWPSELLSSIRQTIIPA